MLQVGMPRRHWAPNLWPEHRCSGDGTTMRAGQSVQVRVKGRRQGIVCGPDEVNLVTTVPLPGANLWWVPLQGIDNQATASFNPSPGQRNSRVVPLMPRDG